MRYYVLSNRDDSIIRRHIIAEVVRDVAEKASDRDESLAGRFAGPTFSILTLDELLDLPNGRQILQTWENGSDMSFYLETAKLERESEPPRHLRLVVEDASAEDERSERATYLIKRAVLLRLESLELVARVEGLRARMMGNLPVEGASTEEGVRRRTANPVPEGFPQEG